jgi:hypothetical protein
MSASSGLVEQTLEFVARVRGLSVEVHHALSLGGAGGLLLPSPAGATVAQVEPDGVHWQKVKYWAREQNTVPKSSGRRRAFGRR